MQTPFGVDGLAISIVFATLISWDLGLSDSTCKCNVQLFDTGNINPNPFFWSLIQEIQK